MHCAKARSNNISFVVNIVDDLVVQIPGQPTHSVSIDALRLLREILFLRKTAVLRILLAVVLRVAQLLQPGVVVSDVARIIGIRVVSGSGIRADIATLLARHAVDLGLQLFVRHVVELPVVQPLILVRQLVHALQSLQHVII